MNGHFHKIAMWLIFSGALVLFYFSLLWFSRGNIIMGFGMLTMAVVAMSNFFLHRRAMEMDTRKKNNHETK